MKNTLEENFINIASTSRGRRIWKLNPELGRASCAALFLDGELYLERVNAVPVLRQLQAERKIPSTLAIFVSSNSAAARHSDYTCDADYTTFVSVR